MKHPLRYVLVLAVATGSVALGACSDDASTGEEDSGGSAGASGSKTGGSSAGGSANSGGKAGGTTAGTSATAGAGGAADGGSGGAVDAGAGGSAGDSGGSDAGGAGGAGLVYACGSDNLWQKTCSAWVAADCPDATVCSDCVTALTADRVGFTDPACAACDDKYEAFYQCQVDAFESDNLAFGVECLEGLGAVETANCSPLLDEAVMCQGYVDNNVDPKPCPATWPVE